MGSIGFYPDVIKLKKFRAGSPCSGLRALSDGRAKAASSLFHVFCYNRSFWFVTSCGRRTMSVFYSFARQLRFSREPQGQGAEY
jgi:hypothetical protein